jgi:hypothetical protein
MTSLPPGSRTGLPAYAALLGYGGLLPFVGCALGLLLLPEAEMRDLAARVLVGYGAVILSFLGGVHWGLVLGKDSPRAPGVLTIGVLPSLAGWLTLLLPFEKAAAAQVAIFGAFWLYEHRVLGPEIVPPAYLALRRWLTLVAIGALGIALMAPSLVPRSF